MCAGHKTRTPSNTPNTRITSKIARAIKKSTFAIDRAPEATPEKPKKPATSEMTKKRMAHLIMTNVSGELGVVG
jgi:hypothetical protein